ncbi:MAG: molybdopterin-dependent oxidoreductase [Nannocystaceae bacterium]|nr:molybdopterin-dependent oxidoreductase [Nannocystaceae bacterium]
MSTRQVHTACPLDCPDACTLTASVEEGRLTRLEGDTRNGLTAGLLCGKVRRFDRHLYGAERIASPAIRDGAKGAGGFRDVSWDEALDHVAKRMLEVRDRSGGEAILPFSYGGSNGALTEGTLDTRWFRRLGASQLERTICAAATSRAQDGLYGMMPGVDVRDYVHASLIVLWGFNPSASGIHLVPVLKAARAAGAHIVVVDPRRIPQAKSADQHLAVRPGTDVVLALAVARWLFEHGHADETFLAAHTTGADEFRARAQPWTLQRAAEVCGLTAAEIEAFARRFAEAEPAVIRCGWGLERNRNGGSAVASVLALPAVAGKFGPRGGGFTMSQSRTFRWNLDPVVAEPEPAVRTINMNRLGAALLEQTPPIEALFVYNANPIATVPDQAAVRRGLAREDLFTVVFDQVHTDTARWADVLLPATTFLEHHDLTRGYGATVLNRIRPAVPAVGLARPNYSVFAELLERTGLARETDITDPEAMAEAITASIGLDSQNRQTLSGQSALDQPPSSALFRDRFAETADGKIHLCPAELDAECHETAGVPLYSYQPDPGSEDYPLALLSPATAKLTNSTFGQLRSAAATVKIHRRDAQARGIHDTDPVRVFNSLGSVECDAEITEDLTPGVLCIDKGLWERHTRNGNTSNALCPTTLTDLGRGATFNDARVQVERIVTPESQ